jgi:hypothetical protein
MLTLYEVKQNGCIRFVYKSSAIIRNVCLMVTLVCIMVPIYIIYFHPGDTSFESMLKVLRGLNSSTFNYLENNKN